MFGKRKKVKQEKKEKSFFMTLPWGYILSTSFIIFLICIAFGWFIYIIITSRYEEANEAINTSTHAINITSPIVGGFIG